MPRHVTWYHVRLGIENGKAKAKSSKFNTMEAQNANLRVDYESKSKVLNASKGLQQQVRVWWCEKRDWYHIS